MLRYLEQFGARQPCLCTAVPRYTKYLQGRQKRGVLFRVNEKLEPSTRATGLLFPAVDQTTHSSEADAADELYAKDRCEEPAVCAAVVMFSLEVSCRKQVPNTHLTCFAWTCRWLEANIPSRVSRALVAFVRVLGCCGARQTVNHTTMNCYARDQRRRDSSKRAEPQSTSRSRTIKQPHGSLSRGQQAPEKDSANRATNSPPGQERRVGVRE